MTRSLSLVLQDLPPCVPLIDCLLATALSFQLAIKRSLCCSLSFRLVYNPRCKRIAHPVLELEFKTIFSLLDYQTCAYF